MNAVIISPEYPTHSNWGGIATFNYSLAHLLENQGHRVRIITLGKERSRATHKSNPSYQEIFVSLEPTSLLWKKIWHFSLIKLIRRAIDKFLPYTWFALQWNIFSTIAFRKLQKQINIDIIHTSTAHVSASFIHFLYPHTPIVFHLQNSKFFERYLSKKIDQLLKKTWDFLYISNVPNYIVACSKSEEKLAKKLYPQIQAKIISIPNFIKNTSSLENKERLNVNNLVYFGRLEQRKGVDLIIESFVRLAKENRDLKLFLIGESTNTFGVDQQHLSFTAFLESKNISPEIKNCIYLLNKIDDKKILFYILKKLKGIAIFPARYEPFGFVNIEAMSLGYLTIVSKRAGMSLYIEDQAGCLVISPSTRNIVQAVKTYQALTPKEISKISDQAVVTVQKYFTADAVNNKYRQLYKSIFEEIN